VPSATIAICTHDREAVVGRAIERAVAEARANDAEVLVVDNASTDRTPALLADAIRRHGAVLRTVDEPRLGLSVARNRALAGARGAVTAFLDDDAVPRPGWLAALSGPYRDPRVACVGGPIRLEFPTPPPAWLTPPLHVAFSAFDLGAAPRRLRYGHDDYPYGANISFRTETARATGGFCAHLGPLGRVELLHDETDLCYRLDRDGHEIHYVPDAIVDHTVLAERLSPERVLLRYELAGRSAAVFVVRNRGVLRALWRVRWLYARHLMVAPYAPREPIDAVRLVRESRRREAIGYIAGLAHALPRVRALRHHPLPTPA
jgi:glucosyl-dolichyl phosphate glucuronosyltransferase